MPSSSFYPIPSKSTTVVSSSSSFSSSSTVNPTPSSTLPKCKHCGGWGKDVVQMNGYCAHCTRTRGNGTSTATVSSVTTSSMSSHPGTKRPRETDDGNDTTSFLSQSSSSSSSSLPQRPTPTDEINRLLQQAETNTDIPTLDANGIKRMLLKVEKAINKNQLHRSKYIDQPLNYLDSEIDLDSNLKLLRTLAAVPEYYTLLLQSNTLPSLLNLFLHDNTLIAMDIIFLFNELWSEDVVGNEDSDDEDNDDNEDNEDNDDKKVPSKVSPYRAGILLLDAFTENSGLEYMLDLMERLLLTCDKDTEDTENLLHLVTLLVRMMEYQPSTIIPRLLTLTKKITVPSSLVSSTNTSSSSTVSTSTTLQIPRLFNNFLSYMYSHRLSSSSTVTELTSSSSSSSSPSNLHQNDLLFACAEGLAIALSLHIEGNSNAIFGQSYYPFTPSSSKSVSTASSSSYYINGIEYLLEILNRYKKYNPSSRSSTDEEEFINNLYDCLVTCLLWYPNQERFRTAEGFELLLRIIHENTFTRYNAFRILSYAITNHMQNCIHFIQQNGLKILFPVFMGYTYPSTKKHHGPDAAKKEEELALTILANCLLFLPHGRILHGTLPTTVIASADGATKNNEGIEWLRILGKFLEVRSTPNTTSPSTIVPDEATPLPLRYEKLDRLIELEVKYRSQLQRYLQNDAQEDEEDLSLIDNERIRNELRYTNYLGHGLYPLQRIYICLGYLLLTDIKDSRYLVLSRLYEQQSSLSTMVEYFQGYTEHLLNELTTLDSENDTTVTGTEAEETKSIHHHKLTMLRHEYEQIQYLQEHLVLIGGLENTGGSGGKPNTEDEQKE